MKKRRIGLLVIGVSLAGFAMPNVLLTILKHNAGTEEHTPPASLEERQAKFMNDKLSSASPTKSSYLNKTTEAITRQLKETGLKKFKIREVAFTSEKTRWIAGQKQVRLTFTFLLQYQNAPPKKQTGSIVLVLDETGEMFDSSIKI